MDGMRRHGFLCRVLADVDIRNWTCCPPVRFSSALEASPKFATMQWPPTVDERYSLAILSS